MICLQWLYMVGNVEFDSETLVCYWWECSSVLNILCFPAESHRTKEVCKY